MVNSKHFIDFLRKMKEKTEDKAFLEAAEKAFRAIFEANVMGKNPRVLITYSIMSEESAQHGDYEETGWIDEEGVSMFPDEIDIQELRDESQGNDNVLSELINRKVVSDTVEYLKREGVIEPSSTHFHPGVWYSTEASPDYKTGKSEERSYHLKDFSDSQQEQIFKQITAR